MARGKTKKSSLLTTQNCVIAGVVAIAVFLACDMISAPPAPTSRSSSTETEAPAPRAPKRELTAEEEVIADKKKATRWMNMGKKFFSGGGRNGQDTEKGFEYAEMAAEAGDVDAAYMVAQCYFYGYATKKDSAKVAHWLQKTLEGAGDDTDLTDGVKKLKDATEPGELSVAEIEELLDFDTGKGTSFQREKAKDREEAAQEKAEKAADKSDDADDNTNTGGDILNDFMNANEVEEEEEVEEV